MKHAVDLIADMLEARADDGALLTSDEMRGVAAMLRSPVVKEVRYIGLDQLNAGQPSAPRHKSIFVSVDRAPSAQIIPFCQGKVR